MGTSFPTPTEDPLARELLDRMTEVVAAQEYELADDGAEMLESLAGRAAGELRALGRAEDEAAIKETRANLERLLTAAAQARPEEAVAGPPGESGPPLIHEEDLGIALQGLCPGLFPFC